MLKRFIFYSLFFWPFIWANADQLWGTAKFIHIPKPILVTIEVSLFIIMIGWVFLRHRINPMFIPYIYAFVLLGILSAFVNGPSLRGVFQVTFKAIRPFLVLFIAMHLKLGEKFLNRSWRFLLLIALVNTAIVFYQFFFLDFYCDEAEGLLEDAHVLSSFLLTIIFLIVARIYFRLTSVLMYILLVLFSVAMVIPFHRKTIFLAIVTIVLGYPILPRKLINLKRYLTSVITILTGYFIVSNILIPATSKMIFQGIDSLSINISSLGPVRGWTKLIREFEMNPQWAVYGMGPGRGGSQFAISRAGSERSKWANMLITQSRMVTRLYRIIGSRALLMDTSGALAIISEFGILGLSLLVLAFWKVLRFLYKVSHSGVKSINWLAYGTLLGLVFTIEMSFISTSTGYFIEANISPLMLMAGLIYSESNKQRSLYK